VPRPEPGQDLEHLPPLAPCRSVLGQGSSKYDPSSQGCQIWLSSPWPHADESVTTPDHEGPLTPRGSEALPVPTRPATRTAGITWPAVGSPASPARLAGRKARCVPTSAVAWTAGTLAKGQLPQGFERAPLTRVRQEVVAGRCQVVSITVLERLKQAVLLLQVTCRLCAAGTPRGHVDGLIAAFSGLRSGAPARRRLAGGPRNGSNAAPMRDSRLERRGRDPRPLRVSAPSRYGIGS
jgi:hypothetical protein